MDFLKDENEVALSQLFSNKVGQPLDLGSNHDDDDDDEDWDDEEEDDDDSN